jgi:hypothetical protein
VRAATLGIVVQGHQHAGLAFISPWSSPDTHRTPTVQYPEDPVEGEEPVLQCRPWRRLAE